MDLSPRLEQLRRDAEGFLLDSDDWNPAVAEALATEEQISLSAAHLEIVYLLRTFYLQTEFAPPMRGLIKLVRQQLGEEKASSLYLLSLFPGQPVKRIAKLAGIPKPDHCL